MVLTQHVKATWLFMEHFFFWRMEEGSLLRQGEREEVLSWTKPCLSILFFFSYFSLYIYLVCYRLWLYLEIRIPTMQYCTLNWNHKSIHRWDIQWHNITRYGCHTVYGMTSMPKLPILTLDRSYEYSWVSRVPQSSNISNLLQLLPNSSCLNQTYAKKNWTLLWSYRTENTNETDTGRLNLVIVTIILYAVKDIKKSLRGIFWVLWRAYAKFHPLKCMVIPRW